MPVDQRFFTFKGPHSLRALLELSGIEYSGAHDPEIKGISSADKARAGDLCFVEGDAAQAAKVSAEASACFVKDGSEAGLPEGVAAIPVAHPRIAHKRASGALYELKSWHEAGDTPAIHPSASIAPTASIGAGAAIGESVIIAPGAVIGPGVQIGARTEIGPNAAICCALIGNDVKIFAGASIGEPGFGVTGGPHGAEDVPQWGRVIIQDHATIGANTCIDRGAFGDTIIGERTKIDNLVQIAHNVVIGRNVIIASSTGIAGSSTVGDGVMMGGCVKIADHVNIGAGAQLAGSSGVFRDIPSGGKWGGMPAKPLRQYLREIAWIQQQVSPKKKPK